MTPIYNHSAWTLTMEAVDVYHSSRALPSLYQRVWANKRLGCLLRAARGIHAPTVRRLWAIHVREVPPRRQWERPRAAISLPSVPERKRPATIGRLFAALGAFWTSASSSPLGWRSPARGR